MMGVVSRLRLASGIPGGRVTGLPTAKCKQVKDLKALYIVSVENKETKWANLRT